MAAELQEIPPTKHAILRLVEARPVRHWPPYVGLHILRSLLETKLEESLPHVDHSPSDFTGNAVVHRLHAVVHHHKLFTYSCKLKGHYLKEAILLASSV